jgi:hypothetical protein
VRGAGAGPGDGWAAEKGGVSRPYRVTRTPAHVRRCISLDTACGACCFVVTVCCHCHARHSLWQREHNVGLRTL